MMCLAHTQNSSSLQNDPELQVILSTRSLCEWQKPVSRWLLGALTPEGLSRSGMILVSRLKIRNTMHGLSESDVDHYGQETLRCPYHSLPFQDKT